MELKAGYKQTDVGVIPEDWTCAELNDFISFISYGFTNPMPTTNSGPYMVTAADINKGRINLETARHTNIEAYEKLLTAKSKPKKNDILLTKDGTLGRVAIAGDEQICINQSVAILRANARTLPTFLASLLQGEYYQKRMIDDAGGSTIKHIYITIVNRMKVGVPCLLEEQQAIVKALSDIDQLIASLDQLISKKLDLKQGAMQQLLTGETRINGFSSGWKETTLRNMLEKPVTDGPHLTPVFTQDGVPFLSVNNLVDGRIDFSNLRFISQKDHELFSQKCKPEKGDILLGKAASVGKVALVATDEEFNIWSPIALIRAAKNYDCTFLYYQFMSRHVLRQIELLTNASSQGNIGMRDIEKLSFLMPERAEQEAIAEILADMDADIAELEQRRNKTVALKQGMMQELLTGRTRLV